MPDPSQPAYTFRESGSHTFAGQGLGPWVLEDELLTRLKLDRLVGSIEVHAAAKDEAQVKRAFEEWNACMTLLYVSNSDAADQVIVQVEKVLPHITRRQAEKYLDDLDEALVTNRELSYRIDECKQRAGKRPENEADFETAIRYVQEWSIGFDTVCNALVSPTPNPMLQCYVDAFWALDKRERIGIIQRLIGEDGAVPGGSGARPAAFTDILQRFLPEQENVSGGRGSVSAGGIAELLLPVFLNPEVVSRKVLAKSIVGILTAIREERMLTVPDEERFGYRLGIFLRELGSGGVKLGQQMHSSPFIRATWCPGLEPLKTDGEKIPRAEAYRRSENEHPIVVNIVDQLGKYQGAGAYFCTYAFKPTDEYRYFLEKVKEVGYLADEIVLQLLKSDAAEEAFEVLDTFIAICNHHMMQNKDDKNVQASTEPILQLLLHARHMVEYETNAEYAARQEMIARNNYRDLVVTVEGLSLWFNTARILDAGKTYKVAYIARGVQINALADDEHSKKVKIGCLVAELLPWMSGRKSDHDGHGRNLATNLATPSNSIVTKFDCGGVALEAPSGEELRCFSSILCDAFFNSKRNRYNFLSSLKHTVHKAFTDAKERGVETNVFVYVNATVRNFLSVGDYAKGQNPRDLRRVLLALLETGQLSGDIFNVLVRRFTAHFILSKRIAPVLWRYSPMMQLELAHESRFYPDNPNPEPRVKKEESIKPEEKDLTKPLYTKPVTIRIRDPHTRGAFGPRLLGRFVAIFGNFIS